MGRPWLCVNLVVLNRNVLKFRLILDEILNIMTLTLGCLETLKLKCFVFSQQLKPDCQKHDFLNNDHSKYNTTCILYKIYTLSKYLFGGLAILYFIIEMDKGNNLSYSTPLLVGVWMWNTELSTYGCEFFNFLGIFFQTLGLRETKYFCKFYD